MSDTHISVKYTAGAVQVQTLSHGIQNNPVVVIVL